MTTQEAVKRVVAAEVKEASKVVQKRQRRFGLSSSRCLHSKY